MTAPVYAIADIHIDNFARWGGPSVGGLNTRGREVLATLKRAVDLATDGPLVLCGDIFHRARPEPVVLTHTSRIIRTHEGGRSFLLVGNHDQESDHPGHHALGPMQWASQVVDQPMEYLHDKQTRLLLFPFLSGPIDKWLPEQLSQLPNTQRTRTALYLHAGIADDETPYYLDATSGAIKVSHLFALMEKHDIDACFSGDWHRHQVWRKNGRVVVQVGSLAPSRFPPNYEHGHVGPMVKWLPEQNEVEVFDVPGPRFYKKRWSELDKSWVPTGSRAYLKLTCRSDQEQAAREWLEALRVRLSLGGATGEDIGGLELEIDRGIEQAKARTASFEARQASSLDEALSRYVQAMPVSKGVERDRVLDHVRRLMA